MKKHRKRHGPAISGDDEVIRYVPALSTTPTLDELYLLESTVDNIIIVTYNSNSFLMIWLPMDQPFRPR